MIGRLDTVTFTAYDAINGSGVTYTLDPGGPLLSGLSIVGNTMTGATTAPEDTGSAVAIRATDNTDPTVFSVRLFSLKAIPAELYAWSSNPFTFTNAGKTGRYGPTITNLTDTYTPLWTNSANFLAIVTQGIQEWTVPMDGSYQIEAYGAAGGGSGNRNGYGARMRGTFSLTKGDVIKILVGQKGGVQNSGAGGGGTFVIRTPYDDTGSILVIAGGGVDSTTTPQRDITHTELHLKVDQRPRLTTTAGHQVGVVLVIRVAEHQVEVDLQELEAMAVTGQVGLHLQVEVLGGTTVHQLFA